MKKIMFITMVLLVFAFNFAFASSAQNETVITLSNTEIFVNNQVIPKEESEIYLQTVIEAHPDVPDDNKNIENKVITITKAGIYRITGAFADTQIRVETSEKKDITLILDNASITCKTAPAILIKNAYDAEEAGKANVKIILENENIVNGSHVAEYYDANDNKIKHDAAISSIPSLVIEGNGSLVVNSDNEGIESKMHLTINGGIIEIFSEDDALNASEDGISHLTINDGSIYAIVGGNGGEGDGMDSNGYITINGGVITAQAHSSSQDSGLDADLGITINGGTVIATGNMYEGIDENSKQQFMQMYFSETQNNQNLIVITNVDEKPVMAFKPINSFTILECSSPEFKNGTYYAYVGGEIEGTEKDGVYTNITSYKKGTQLSHTGAMENNMRPGMSGANNGVFPGGNGMQRPNGFNLDNLDYSGITLPEGVTEEQITEIIKQVLQNNFNTNMDKVPNEGGVARVEGERNPQTPPSEGEMPNNRFNRNGQSNQVNNENRSYEFILSETEHVYRGVAPVKANETNNGNMQIIEEVSNINTGIIIVCLIIIIICLLIVIIRKKK